MGIYLGSQQISAYAGGIAVPAADGIDYDNTASGLVASNVQTAIDEMVEDLGDKANASHTHSEADLPVIPITKGGTGATTAAQALQNLGITYGTDDLTAGSSPLETGKLYFKYE